MPSWTNMPWSAPAQGYYPPSHIYAPSRPWWEQPAWNPEAYGPRAPAPPIAGTQSKKYPNLNPILAADTTLLRFDVRKKPLTEILASTYYSNRHSPAFATSVHRMRLVCKTFPWTIDIEAPSNIPCEAIWDALYTALQEPIADSEWGFICMSRKQREVVESAMKRRLDADPTDDKRFKRIDYLGEVTHFKGLERDEDFERMRLLPGSKTCPETWVVKLSS